MASKKKTTEEQLVKAHADAARRAAEANEQLRQARAAEEQIVAKLIAVEADDRPELIEQLIRARGAVAAMEAVVGQLDRRAADAEIAVAELNAVRAKHGLPAVDHRQAARAPEAVEA